MMRKLEFPSPERKNAKLEKEKRGYQFVNRIIRLIILNRGKNVLEPILVLDLAEQTLERAEHVQKTD